MNGKHLSRVASLGIYLLLWIFSFYLVLQVPQFTVLKLEIINKNTKPCIAGDTIHCIKKFFFIKNKSHSAVCKCNAPNTYMQFIQLKQNENFLRVEDTVSLWLHIADILSLQQLFEVIMFNKNSGNQKYMKH